MMFRSTRAFDSIGRGVGFGVLFAPFNPLYRSDVFSPRCL